MRNIEILSDYFMGRDPQLKETLADNSLRLIGIRGEEFALMCDVRRLINALTDEMEKTDLELAGDILDLKGKDNTQQGLIDGLRRDLDAHAGDTTIHVTPQLIARIQASVTNTELAQALSDLLRQAKNYTDQQISALKDYVDSLIVPGLTYEIVPTLPTQNIKTNVIYLVPSQSSAGNNYYDEYLRINNAWELIGTTQAGGMAYQVVQSLPVQDIQPNVIYLVPKQNAGTDNAYTEYLYVNNNWEVFGSTDSDQVIQDIQEEPNTVINSDYFYRFKNLIDNSSFEVFNGQTGVPYGWTGCTVDANASMFGTYSMKIAVNSTAQQVEANCADVQWAQQAYDTEDMILAFYHKFGGCIVQIYDLDNQTHLDLTELDSSLTPVGMPSTFIEFPYKANWNKYRNYIKFTPLPTTHKVRVEISCPNTAQREVYIDGLSMEPYEEGEFPSIYKEGRYSISAAEVQNPPPGDVDRFTAFEHFNIRNGVEDANGFLTYQELAREDGTLAVTRQASNPDANGFYQTVVETFYKADGQTVEYTDTYTYTFSSAGAIKSRTRTTT